MAKEPGSDTSGLSETPVAARTAPDSDREAAGDRLLREELAEVRELARSLMTAVQDIQAQNARTQMVRGAVEDVKAEVRAASQALMSQPAPAPYMHERAAPWPEAQQPKKGCGPCECVGDSCCAFDIKVWQVRASLPQIEPPDMGDVPLLINALEVQIYCTVDDIGILIPGIGSTMDLRAAGLPKGPGAWVISNRVVQRVIVPRGTPVTKTLRVEVREHDEGAERPLAFKDEFGEATGTITLDCCSERIYPAMPLDVHLHHGGEGGGIIQVAFYAERVCC